jgi:hypothetical protein
MRYLLLFTLFALPAGAAELSVSRADCRALTAHRPAAGVAYQEGVDVRGRAVAPADLPSNVAILGDNITIPLQVDVAQRFGISMGAAAGSKATVGVVTVDNGRAYLNGQPLDAARQDELAVLCLEPNPNQP